MKPLPVEGFFGEPTPPWDSRSVDEGAAPREPVDAAEPCYGKCDACPRVGPITKVAGKYWLCETCKALPDGAA